jgi:copper(I)-binding protein
MSIRFPSLLLGAALVCSSAWAQEYHAGQILISHVFARATVPGQPSGAAYLTLENRGAQADRLLAAATPAASRTEIHTMIMDGNLMKMREVQQVDLAPKATVDMTPGHGYHLMLLELKQPLKAGSTLPLTLTFEKAGKVEVSAPVKTVQPIKRH